MPQKVRITRTRDEINNLRGGEILLVEDSLELLELLVRVRTQRPNRVLQQSYAKYNSENVLVDFLVASAGSTSCCDVTKLSHYYLGARIFKKI